MKRVLFVDDEELVLSGLKRMLRGQRHEWDMAFVTSGEAALGELATTPFDVIVSDMRMPGMDGITLLTNVHARFPDVVRIVLSGHTELEAAMRTVPIAHQFLAKPTNADTVREVVTRAVDLHALIGDDEIRSMIGAIDTLPTLPRIYAALIQTLADPEASLADVGRIVEEDVGMCGKVLQMVNSAFFGLPHQVASIREAVNYLGLEMLKNLVLSVEVFRAFDGPKLAGFSPDAAQSHALIVSQIAKRVSADKRVAEDAFLAAMLHDIGKLILAQYLPDYFGEVLTRAHTEGRPLHVVESECRGVCHAEVGAYLLALWGLPYPIVEAVAHHHDPARVEQGSFGVLGAVHVANGLFYELSGASEGAGASPAIDVDYLRALGVDDQLSDWRTMAAEYVGESVAA